MVPNVYPSHDESFCKVINKNEILQVKRNLTFIEKKILKVLLI